MEHLIKSSAIIILFYLCYKLFLQKETFFESNRWFLLTGLISALFIPLIVIPIYITIEPSQLSTIASSNIISTKDIAEESISTSTIIFSIYILVAIGLFIKLLFQLKSLSKLLLANKKLKEDKFRIIKTNSDNPPFSFFNWIVFNPNQFETKELQQIITHEKVHAKQLHSLDIIISHLSCIVFWFNPIVWLYKKDIEQNLEYIADKSTQNIVNCSKSYQHLLLKTSVPNYKMALTNNFYNSLIKKRIVMLHKNRSKNSNQWKLLLILPLLAIFLMSFNTKEVYTTDEEVVENHDHDEDVEMVIITKDMSDADLDKLKKELSKKGITIKFKGVKRNSKDEITAIKIDVSVKKANSNYHTSSDESIKPIKISFTDDSISIGNSNDIHFGEGYAFVTKDKNHKIHRSGSGNNVFVIRDDAHEGHGETHEIIEDDDKIIIKSGDKVHEILKSGEHKNAFFISEDGDKVIELKKKGNKNKDEIIIIKEDKNGNIISEWIEDKDENIWVKEDNNVIKIKTKGNGNDKVFISTNDGKEPLIIVDGKEMSKKEFEKIKPDNIEKVEVLKGENATKKYGKKAKDGVIVVTTKK